MNKSQPITYNTYIGGVSATISTAALLATKLGISVGRIENFTIVGSDIKCKITGGGYTLSSNFYNDTSVTYYRDIDSLITSFLNNTFSGAANFFELVATGVTTISGQRNFQNTKLTLLNFPNLTSTGIIAFNEISQNKSFTTQIYIPSCLTLGVNVNTNESVFFGITSGSKIYAHPSLATINSGGVEADLAYAITQGAIVNYVTNYTSPSPVTTLAAGTIYNTAIQLNFTAPSSTNAIDYYECYANGVLKNTITASGQYITGLTASTSYSITLIAVDIFYNKSVVSNSVTQSTNTTSAIPTTGLVSYYKLDETSGIVANDSFGSNNLTNTGVTINQIGKIGNSYLSIAGSQYLNSSSFPTISTTISFNLWVYRTGTGTGTYPQLIGTGSYAANAGMSILITPSGDLGWIIKQDYLNFSASTNIPLNTWRMVTVTFDGSNVKTYIDAVLLRNNAKIATLGSTSLFRMYATQGNDGSFIGKIDETAIYNTALTQTEIDLLYNSGNGITL